MKKIKIALASLVSLLAFAPALAFAQTFQLQNGSLGGILISIGKLLSQIVPILIALAVVVFLWGVLKFIFNAGDEAKRQDGKWIIIYSLIGIVVMVSVWGLVSFVQGTFGLSSDRGPNAGQLPTVPQPNLNP